MPGRETRTLNFMGLGCTQDTATTRQIQIGLKLLF
jgi:hypothetical protein